MKADLLSEQALLCSLLPFGAKKCFDLLVKKGIPKEVAYFECWQELSLIAKTMVNMGPEKFFDLISPNALVGGLKGQKKLLNETREKNLEELWEDIDQGTFLKDAEQTNFAAAKDQAQEEWLSSELGKTHQTIAQQQRLQWKQICLLYTSDAADES